MLNISHFPQIPPIFFVCFGAVAAVIIGIVLLIKGVRSKSRKGILISLPFLAVGIYLAVISVMFFTEFSKMDMENNNNLKILGYLLTF